jgi:peptide/nickel transport system substrate-binding protein
VIYQTCGAPQNMAKYCDKEVDAWHQEARAATDLAARKAIYRKITERFLDKGWIMYLYHPQNLVAHTARLEGLRPVPDGILRVVGLKLK